MRLIVFINFLINGAMFLSFFYVPALAKKLAMQPSALAFLLTASAIVTVVTNYVAGWSSDRFGRMPFIRAGLALSALSFAGFFFTTNISHLVYSRFLLGLAWGFFSGAFVAYVSDSGISLAKYSAFASLGATGFLLIGAVITSFVDVKWVFLFCSLTFMIAIASTFFLPGISSEKEKQVFWPGPLIRKNLSVYLCVFLRHTGASSMWVLWTYYLIALGAGMADIGLINSINTITQFLFAYFLVDRMINRKAFQWGLFLSIMAFISFTFADNHYHIYPSQILLGASWACFYSGSLKLLEAANPVEKGAAIGMLGSVMQCSFVFGPVIASVIFALLPGPESFTAADGFSPEYAASFVEHFRIVIYCASGLAMISWIFSLCWTPESN